MRILIFVAVIAATSVLACDTGEEGLAGRFNLLFVETNDTCDSEENQYTTSVTIRREGDGFEVDFGSGNVLTGSLDENGILDAEGPFVLASQERIEGFMEIAIAVVKDELDALGFIRFDGTFPGVTGTCLREFGITGRRVSLAPLLPTGPR